MRQTAKQPAGASEAEDNFKGGNSVPNLHVAIHLLAAEQAGTEGYDGPYKVNILLWLAPAQFNYRRSATERARRDQQMLQNSSPYGSTSSTICIV